MSLFRLQKIAECIGSDDRTWLLNAINSWEAGAQLDIALGLCGGAAITRRNLALRAAADILNPNGDFTRHSVAGLLETSIRRFEYRTLPRYRKNENMELSEIDTHLLVMFSPRCRVVRARRQLFEIIR